MSNSKALSIVSTSELTTQVAKDLAAQAFIYGYPLVLMDLTRQVMTNTAEPGQSSAPMNQLANMRSFPDHTMTDVVSPNADTLYTFAFLDLSREPMVLSVPDGGKRYYFLQMLDGWTNVFACPGTRTTGSSREDFAIVGPGRAGSLPEDVKVIKSLTSLVWIIGRTQTNGKQDYAAVNAIQEQYKLTPLSCWGKDYDPPRNWPIDPAIDMHTPPPEQLAKMDAATFFERLNALMKTNRPAPDDVEVLKRFAEIGIAPGWAFNLKALHPAVSLGLQEGVQEGRTRILAEARKPQGRILNGWQVMTDLGNYGTNYLWRAVVAMIGLGANLPDDAIYPHATTDSSGEPLHGANRYEIRFLKGQLPPVNAFWSITMYNSRQYFVNNPINRYAIGDRDRLNFDADGSLKIFIQKESPGKEKEANWLPAPEDSFNLFMRLYWPKAEILQGSWKPPEIKRGAAESRKVA